MSGQDLAELTARARRWRAADPDPRTQAMTDEVLDRADATELQELFGTELSFGTAGLRAPLGPGPNRMNRLVVRRTAAALAAHLGGGRRTAGPRPSVVVGRDARHGSAAFGADLVEVLTAAGVDVEHFDEPVPTPLLAVAVRERRASAGVMVTASHNPAQDNGLKVYAADGAQIVAPTDRRIAALLAEVPLEPVPAVGSPGTARPLGGPTLGGAVTEAYLAHAATLVDQRAAPTGLRVAHTSLHGVGDVLLRSALALVPGLTSVAVAAQQQPDPDFPTVASPNPEEPGTLDALLALAAEHHADVGLALDPDADRLAVALPDGRGDATVWRTLHGDELGALLAAHLLATTDGPDRLVVTTVVSSRLVPAMCAAAGVHHVETLTGFKWLCRPGIAHSEWRQLLAYEEALGYAVGPTARDKDGITAALVVLEALSGWRRAGSTPWQVLDQLARRHGAHVTDNGSVRHGSLELLTDRVGQLADRPPGSLGGIELAGHDRPASDVLRWHLADDTRVVVRPSGTEPKVKYYAEAIEPVAGSGPGATEAARAVARERLGPVVRDLRSRLTD